MTRFSVMWTHSVQIYANVLWGEDKRNSSWSNKALDNHSLSDTAVWCHFCPLGGKEGSNTRRMWCQIQKGRFQTDSEIGHVLECVLYWNTMATEAFCFIIFLLLVSDCNFLFPAFILPAAFHFLFFFFFSFCCLSFTSSTPFLPTFILAPSHLPSPPLASLCSPLPGID